MFSQKRDITLSFYTLLDCHYGCYFIAACGIKRFNVTIFYHVSENQSCDPFANMICKYFQNSLTDMKSFHFCLFGSISLSPKGMEQFAKSLSAQNNILSMHLHVVICAPGCVTILCNSICKYNPQITNLLLPPGELNENDVAIILTTLSLNSLCMWCSPSEGMGFDLSLSVCKRPNHCKNYYCISGDYLRLRVKCLVVE